MSTKRAYGSSRNPEYLQEQINSLWAYIDQEAWKLPCQTVKELYQQLDLLCNQLNYITNSVAHLEAQQKANSRLAGEW